MHVLVTITDKQRMMFIAKGKRALKPYMDMAERKGWAWRYHGGSGWADGSSTGWMEIQSVTEPCMATILY